MVKFNKLQKDMIEKGEKLGVDTTIYAKPIYNDLQMGVLLSCLVDKISIEYIAKPKYSAKKMLEIRYCIEAGIEVVSTSLIQSLRDERISLILSRFEIDQIGIDTILNKYSWEYGFTEDKILEEVTGECKNPRKYPPIREISDKILSEHEIERGIRRENNISIQGEFTMCDTSGLDMLERRFYPEIFKKDIPLGEGIKFSEIEEREAVKLKERLDFYKENGGIPIEEEIELRQDDFSKLGEMKKSLEFVGKYADVTVGQSSIVETNYILDKINKDLNSNENKDMTEEQADELINGFKAIGQAMDALGDGISKLANADYSEEFKEAGEHISSDKLREYLKSCGYISPLSIMKDMIKSYDNKGAIIELKGVEVKFEILEDNNKRYLINLNYIIFECDI